MPFELMQGLLIELSLVWQRTYLQDTFGFGKRNLLVCFNRGGVSTLRARCSAFVAGSPVLRAVMLSKERFMSVMIDRTPPSESGRMRRIRPSRRLDRVLRSPSGRLRARESEKFDPCALPSPPRWVKKSRDSMSLDRIDPKDDAFMDELLRRAGQEIRAVSDAEVERLVNAVMAKIRQMHRHGK